MLAMASAGETIGAVLLLCTGYSPYARRYHLYARQQCGRPFLHKYFRLKTFFNSHSSTVREERHITNAEHHTTLLQFVDTNLHISETRHFEIAGFRLP